MTDQAALGPDGQLLDASKIAWFNDPDDPKPIQPCTTAMLSTSSVQGQCSHPVHITAGSRLADALAAEKLDEFGKPSHSSRRGLNQPLN
ncbi:hypothetical protein DFH94DRAFT_696155 [Russula ochroleuca]|uniref:Uncharacterized protein n=1 Tax=Russula ochroleuca TaxID=152965 RepID=A0A9P5JYZ5_9AGAM|nr:hypothetical protein DFH94DRAFT_696155 [Russula ochroleuca]